MKVSSVLPPGSSWRLRGAAIAVAMTAVANALGALTDNDPATFPDWHYVIGAVVTAFGLASARDNNVTSEQAGASIP